MSEQRKPPWTAAVAAAPSPLPPRNETTRRRGGKEVNRGEEEDIRKVEAATSRKRIVKRFGKTVCAVSFIPSPPTISSSNRCNRNRFVTPSLETVTTDIIYPWVFSRVHGSRDHPLFAQLRANLWCGHRVHIKTPLYTIH